MDLALQVGQMVRKNGLIRSGDAVVCAVSGGPDSMALLHVLARLAEQLECRVVAAHVNHGFRGAESDREEEAVLRYAEALGIPAESTRVDAPGYARERGMNAQAAARELRYRFLLDAAKRRGAAAIALAHHLDDQAETVLLHLLSGSSLRGLSGMAPSRVEEGVRIIRPFLNQTKQNILAYIEDQGIPYCVDSSNASRQYARNRLRLDVMPLLASFNPKVLDAIGQTADLLREEDDYMHSLAEECAGRMVRLENGQYTSVRSDWTSLHVALQRRLIHLILYYLAGDPGFPDYAKVESIRTAIANEAPPSLYLDIGAGIRFERIYDRLVWSRNASRTKSAAYSFEIPLKDGLRLPLPEASGILQIDVMSWGSERETPRSRSEDEAWFDLDRLDMPLTVRSRRDGDRIAPLGVAGTKKVKDLFIDSKVDPDRRARVPLIVDGQGRVLWIAGIRRSGEALVTPQTKHAVRMKFLSESCVHNSKKDQS